VSTLSSSRIEKTPGVCGGQPCMRDTRITVWMIVLDRKLGLTDVAVLDAFPSLTPADLDAAWKYYRENPVEIEQSIWLNDTAANVPDGVPPPAWVIVSGRLLGLPDDRICEAFVPPLDATDLDAAWAAYRADPTRLGREIAVHRLAG
jgi:uncharacterized protein (DUF433 family)